MITNRRDGTIIIAFGESMAELILWITVFCFILNVTGKFIVQDFLLVSCVFHWAFEGLSLLR